MLHVSIFVELLRSQPRLIFWFATLTQAALWWLVPSLFYAAPPGDLPSCWRSGTSSSSAPQGPPLAYWLAELAFSLGFSASLSVPALRGRHLLGHLHARPRHRRHPHAVMAVLLMVGITALYGADADFGPACWRCRSRRWC